ncbi:MAG: transglycosylase family protein [Candidatus Dormibacteraeota bacterium]|nr:transglycosylase family protein [Candidatus Dormibacteraeota bacterium]
MKKTLCFAAFSAGAMLAGAGVASAQEAPPPSDQPPARPHTVTAGESLSKISQAELATPDRWVEIFTLNRDAIANPDMVEIGQVINIPLAPVAVPADLLASLTSASPPAPKPSGRSVTTGGQAAAHTAASTGGGGGNLATIRACESGGDYGSVSSNGVYQGAYQFDRQTWQAVGGSGDPAAASPSEQDARAAQLQSERGSNPWPNCG